MRFSEADQGAAGRVHAALRRAIIAREHVPGEVLSRTDIARAMGVSATPVREALDRLAGEGFVEVRPRSGTVVAPIDVMALHEGQFLAVALGREAVRRLAARPGAVARARAALDDGDEFRRALLAGVGMERLWDGLKGYFGALDRCRALGTPRVEPRELREDVLDRIAARDAAGAEEAIRTLLAGDMEPLGTWRRVHPEMFS